MGRLTAFVRPRREVSEGDVAEMYRLYAEYYAATSQDLFQSDLANKDYVIELRDGLSLKGFSTLAVMDYDVTGDRHRALFSGDTIIDRRYWGEQALAQAFCRHAGAVKAQRPDLPLSWFLISKGYRTYRYLSVFAHDYFPNPAKPTPPRIQEHIDLLARGRFGNAYCAEDGLVRFPASRGHLKPRWATVGEGALKRAEVRYFLERNPRFHAGEELCCITSLETGNLRSFARRAFLEGLHDERDAFFVSEHRRGFGPFPRHALASADGAGAPAAGDPPA
jgi:hypothetical protein